MYMVMRSDDNGHTFVVGENLTAEEASALFHRVSRGHKQVYFVRRYQDEAERQQLIELYNVKL
jgi:hypothetical protein